MEAAEHRGMLLSGTTVDEPGKLIKTHIGRTVPSCVEKSNLVVVQSAH